jgi:hypothetical protein
MESSILTSLLEQDLLDSDSLARKLSVSPDTVRTWTKKKRIPSFVLGHRTVRYSFPAVVSALSRFYQPPKQAWSRKLPKRKIEFKIEARTYQTELILEDGQRLLPL